MPEDKVPTRTSQTLRVVEGDLTIGDQAVIKGQGTPPKVTVSGTVRCRGSCTFESSLEAQNLEGEGNIIVKGDLTIKERVEIGNGGFGVFHERAALHVEGKMTARTVDVDNEVTVGKDLEAESVEVGGRLEVTGNTKAKSIDVGGSFTSAGEVEAETIDVGGSVAIESPVKVEKIDVGGSARVGGASGQG